MISLQTILSIFLSNEPLDSYSFHLAFQEDHNNMEKFIDPRIRTQINVQMNDAYSFLSFHDNTVNIKLGWSLTTSGSHFHFREVESTYIERQLSIGSIPGALLYTYTKMLKDLYIFISDEENDISNWPTG